MNIGSYYLSRHHSIRICIYFNNKVKTTTDNINYKVESKTLFLVLEVKLICIVIFDLIYFFLFSNSHSI